MRLGIDGANLRSGGSFTHLYELLRHADPAVHGFERVVIWGCRDVLRRLPDGLPWLEKTYVPALDGSLWPRWQWQRRELPLAARQQCDVLFVPGGWCTDRFRPVVTMSRNLLPFTPREMARYGRASREYLINLLRRRAQIRSYRRADGVIFLNDYARLVVTDATGPLPGKTAVIPHGVDERFRRRPAAPRMLADCSPQRPFRLFCVSTIDVFKHPWNVAEAVATLRSQGLSVAIDFIGGAYPPARKRLDATLRRLDPGGQFLRYLGQVPYEELSEHHHSADGFVFASSCENQPNSLVEAMAAGLPIACAACRPMPDILGEGGVYFDPEQVGSIAKALESLLRDAAARQRRAGRAFELAERYCWRRTAAETLSLLSSVGHEAAGRQAPRRQRAA